MMDSILLWVIVFCFLGGVLGVAVASIYLLLPGAFQRKILPHMVSFATGTLLCAAFISLLPRALEHPSISDVHDVMITVLIGLLTFFLLEKLVLWRHCHHDDCEAHSTQDQSHERQQAAGQLILIGDGLHNFVDGILIAAAFLVDVRLGIVTSLAVAAHEIPQEVGDIAIMLHSGFSRRKALLFNVLASLMTVVGGVVGYYALAASAALLPYVLALAASSFIYIAVADLIPGLHKRTQLSETLQQMIAIIIGILLIYWVQAYAH